MKLLVTGATGTVGGALARILSNTDHDVVALVRDPSTAQLPAEVTIVQGDLTVADDVRRALDGVDRAFLNMADDNGATFAAVAGEMGVRHVVLLSSFASVTPLRSGDDNMLTARHRAGEQALSAAGVPATFLRATGFDYNILMWTGGLADGVIRHPFPDVELAVVHPDDIAAAAAAALTSPNPPGGAISITGPEKVSVRAQTQILAGVLERELRVEQITEDQAAGEAFPPGTPAFVSTSVIEVMRPEAAVVEPSDGVPSLTGRAPRTFAEWAREHAATLAGV